MRRYRFQNVERILAVVRQLGELSQEVVFAGGAATGLLITDPAIPDVRPTIDIDIIVEVITRTDTTVYSNVSMRRAFENP